MRMTILVVDDDADIRAIMAEHLRKLGHSVVQANCGQAAISLLEYQRVDSVLSDLRMPNGNGLKVRDFAAAHNIPVVIMSGYTEAYGSFLNGVKVISKPCGERELRECFGDDGLELL